MDTKDRATEWGNIDVLEGGWIQLGDPLPEWEAFAISVRADLVNGEPRVTGLRLEPYEGASKQDAVLTVSRLRTLPLADLAPLAYHLVKMPGKSAADRLAQLIEHLDQMSARVKKEAEREAAKAGRAKASPETVAGIYSEARERGKAPRAAVCAALHISTRTADRYIAEARRRGILAPYDENDHKTSTPNRGPSKGRKTSE